MGYQYLGKQTVKNIPDPVRAYKVLMEPEAAGKVIGEKEPKQTRWGWKAVAAVAVLVLVVGGLVWNFYGRAPKIEPASKEKMALPLPDKPSIAVLPFVNMSGDPEQAYFADGMTEDLITDLSKVAGLLVIARNSTFAYKGKATDIREIAKALGVRYVLEGSVRRSGGEIRVNAQLIDATTGGHVWADRLRRRHEKHLRLAGQGHAQCGHRARRGIDQGRQGARARRRTENAQAYDVFLKGWQHYLRQTPEDFRAAIDHFKKAVELDPKYGRAYAALAATYWEASTRYWDVALGFRRHQKRGTRRNSSWRRPCATRRRSRTRSPALCCFTRSSTTKPSPKRN